MLTLTTNAQLQMALHGFRPSPLERAARKSWAYYRGIAYDERYGSACDSPYVEWDTIKQGPRPRVTKLAQIIIDSGAEFLFSDPPRITISGKEITDAEGRPQPDEQAQALQKCLQGICDANELSGEYVPLARQAGNEGGVWFRFVFRPEDVKCPVQIDTFSPYQVTAIYDPLNTRYLRKIILKIKFSAIQDDGKTRWYWYREDWTETKYTRYQLLETNENDDTQVLSQMNRGEWPVDSAGSGTNTFGVIPFQYVYNRKVAGDTTGRGDLWDIYPELNQLSHTAWLQHRSNQRDGDPVVVFINADDSPAYLMPGDVVKINGTQDGTDAKLLVPENNLREWIKQYAVDLERETLDAVGADRANPEEITNKGNLTAAVKEFVYQRSVKTTMEKRTNWGPCGLECFFEKMLLALSRLPDAVRLLPELSVVNEADKTTYDVRLRWQPLFRVTAEELTAIINNMAMCVSSGFLTRERAVGVIADAMGIDDVANLLKELEAAIEHLEAMDEAALSAAESAANPEPKEDSGE